MVNPMVTNEYCNWLIYEETPTPVDDVDTCDVAVNIFLWSYSKIAKKTFKTTCRKFLQDVLNKIYVDVIIDNKYWPGVCEDDVLEDDFDNVATKELKT